MSGNIYSSVEREKKNKQMSNSVIEKKLYEKEFVL